MNDGIIPARPASYDKKVGLVLQGGGALGSYQGGVYEALAASEYLPDWVAGISIGAINAAVIAGNTPEHRVQRLRSFWEEITASTSLWHSAADGPIVEWQQWAGAFTALMFGQPGFFEPRKPHDWFSSNKSVSYYKTSALKSTLERLIDFDRINHAREMRLSAPRIIVHHVREWRVGEQSSVPILFAIDLDRRKAGRYCPTRHNMLGTNCNFLAIEIVEVAGPHVDRTDA